MQTLIAIPKEEFLARLYMLQERKDKIKNELDQIAFERDCLIEQCNQHGIKEDDHFYLDCREKYIRGIHIPSFKEHFPEAYKTLKQRRAVALHQQLDDLVVADLDTVSVKDAEELVGRIPLLPCCTVNKVVKYTIVPKRDDAL